jgi:signal transduction histidine kinase
MPGGGLLMVRTQAAPGGPENGRAGPWLCLTVQDSGEGMTAELQRRIFEPFFSTKERGTGLGLSIVQQIIAAFGGQITVDSAPGRGSRFDIWLPLMR